jgi:type III pantothenate kinase
MILCLDLGNSNIFGAVYSQNELLLQFRYPSDEKLTSDQLGIFFRQVLQENNLDYTAINHVGYCSVVPSLDYSVQSAFIKYFNKKPFVLQPGVKTGIKIKSKNPLEVGSDRIANAISAHHQFPDKNIIIIDFGTATTLDTINTKAEYLGGVILPGLKISMRALSNYTAKLAPVSIIKPERTLGQTTVSNIQSGLYFGHIGAVRYLVEKIKLETFATDLEIVVIGTGGFATLFAEEDLFTCIMPDLTLQGVRLTLMKNLSLIPC